MELRQLLEQLQPYTLHSPPPEELFDALLIWFNRTPLKQFKKNRPGPSSWTSYLEHAQPKLPLYPTDDILLAWALHHQTLFETHVSTLDPTSALSWLFSYLTSKAAWKTRVPICPPTSFRAIIRIMDQRVPRWTLPFTWMTDQQISIITAHPHWGILSEGYHHLYTPYGTQQEEYDQWERCLRLTSNIPHRKRLLTFLKENHRSQFLWNLLTTLDDATWNTITPHDQFPLWIPLARKNTPPTIVRSLLHAAAILHPSPLQDLVSDIKTPMMATIRPDDLPPLDVMASHGLLRLLITLVLKQQLPHTSLPTTQELEQTIASMTNSEEAETLTNLLIQLHALRIGYTEAAIHLEHHINTIFGHQPDTHQVLQHLREVETWSQNTGHITLGTRYQELILGQWIPTCHTASRDEHRFWCELVKDLNSTNPPFWTPAPWPPAPTDVANT